MSKAEFIAYLLRNGSSRDDAVLLWNDDSTRETIIDRMNGNEFVDGQTYQIFVDGFGEITAVYDAVTDEFVFSNELQIMRIERTAMANNGPMNAIL